MLILYVAMKHDYGKPEQGYSFEHYNFYDALLHMGHDILYFDFVGLMQRHGREWMNRRLLEVTKAKRPDLMFTVLFTDELDPKAVREVSNNTDTVTLNWFCDDHWRFDEYSRRWAPCFNWVVTTAETALPEYQGMGYRNVIKSQWACNHFLYRKLDLPREYDVTFVGQPHGNRREIIQALRDAGISVRVWGHGWESGRLTQDEMIRVFNQSRINLSLSNASVPVPAYEARAKGVARRRLLGSLEVAPFSSLLKSMGRRWRSGKGGHFHAEKKIFDRFNARAEQYSDQIKGRNFEIPGCGGFLLTGRAENLEDYYQVGKEVVCYDTVEDLIDKIRYYLCHEGERETIAQSGYQRTLREHTYPQRFTEIFQRMAVADSPRENVLDGKVLSVEIDGYAK